MSASPADAGAICEGTVKMDRRVFSEALKMHQCRVWAIGADQPALKRRSKASVSTASRVQTPTGHAGDENPERDEQLRLHLPNDASPQEDAGHRRTWVLTMTTASFSCGSSSRPRWLASGTCSSPTVRLIVNGRTHRVSY